MELTIIPSFLLLLLFEIGGGVHRVEIQVVG